MQTKSLYDRLGGRDAINALTESWVARLGAMTGPTASSLGPTSRGSKRSRRPVVRGHRRSLRYTGRSMRETHAGMKITAGEFDVVMQHLGATLDELNVPKMEQGELVGLIMPMRDDIVEVDRRRRGRRFLIATRLRPL